MPTTSNVEWDPGLAAYKGPDTTAYVSAAAAAATACASCRKPVSAQVPLSLAVDVTGATDEDGIEYFAFDAEICHRACREPSLTFTPGHTAPVEFTPRAARLVLEDRAVRTTTAGLVFTYLPMLSFREPGGELTSALVTALLSQGFQLAMSADVGEILRDSGQTADDFNGVVTAEGLLTLHAGEATMYREQLDLADPEDATWLDVARNGSLLVIGGDNLIFNGTGSLDLNTAALLGTLVAGKVAVSLLQAEPTRGESGPAQCADDAPRSAAEAHGVKWENRP
ncbi:hypothetical protein [Arthrobacter sp. QXT-31]|uniref:hypothetical protein n=1 Tax=Arthrobacter sp. QXT-31 TaxID=1357915 RepID=UPI000971B0CB|nr:hypothetical protein [Arthrobacter sp. QXT-31]APX04141.1 hypothetical protein BWQ92_22520 [Arthrobacter sp. QXT-31]